MYVLYTHVSGVFQNIRKAARVVQTPVIAVVIKRDPCALIAEHANVKLA